MDNKVFEFIAVKQGTKFPWESGVYDFRRTPSHEVLSAYREFEQGELMSDTYYFLRPVSAPAALKNELVDLVAFINALTPSMAENYMRHDYRSMWDTWQMVTEKIKSISPLFDPQTGKPVIAPAALPMTREEASEWAKDQVKNHLNVGIEYGYIKGVKAFYDHLASLNNREGEQKPDEYNRHESGQLLCSICSGYPAKEVSGEWAVCEECWKVDDYTKTKGVSFESFKPAPVGEIPEHAKTQSFIDVAANLYSECRDEQYPMSGERSFRMILKAAVHIEELTATPPPVPSDVEGWSGLQESSREYAEGILRIAYGESWDRNNPILVSTFYGRMLEKISHSFPTAAPEPWVRVEDKQPEEDGLIIARFQSMVDGRIDFNVEKYSDMEVNEYWKWTHWMRLPAPPKH